MVSLKIGLVRPNASSAAPVIAEAASEARNNASAEISSGRISFGASRLEASTLSTPSVSTPPEQMQFTSMPQLAPVTMATRAWCFPIRVRAQPRVEKGATGPKPLTNVLTCHSFPTSPDPAQRGEIVAELIFLFVNLLWSIRGTNMIRIKMFMAPMLLALSAIVLAQTQRLDVKGITLGTSESELLRLSPGIYCLNAPDSALAERLCRGPTTTYAEVPATIFYYLTDGLIDNINIDLAPKDFEIVVDVLRLRHGAPIVDDQRPMVTRGGLKFLDRRLEWRVGGDVIVARRYAGRADKSNITFTDQGYLQRFIERSKARDKNRLKDL